MKILQIGKYYPPDFGGIETVTQILTEELNQKGVQSDVLCSNSSFRTRIDILDNFRVIRVASLGKLFSTPISPSFFIWLWRLRNQYDLIHLHLPNPLAELAFFLICPKAKLVLHWHADVDPQRFKFLRRIYAPLNHWMIRRANKVIGATNSHIQNSYASHLMLGKDEIIPFPFRQHEKSEVGSLDEIELAELRGRFIIFSVGRLVEYKGFKYLIDAAKSLPPDCLIIIAGSGPLYSALNNQIVNGNLGDRVKMIGVVSQSKLLAYFSACDIFCLPSIDRSEMFGMVQLEAMAFRKPIVATKIPASGVSEVGIHKETGYYVPIKDSFALTESILELRNSPLLRKRMGEAGFRILHEKYDKSSIIKRFIRLYDACFQGKLKN